MSQGCKKMLLDGGGLILWAAQHTYVQGSWGHASPGNSFMCML